MPELTESLGIKIKIKKRMTRKNPRAPQVEWFVERVGTSKKGDASLDHEPSIRGSSYS